MLPRRLPRPSILQHLRQHAIQKRTLVDAPKPGSGPLMSRRADRALPSINTSSWHLYRSVPLFLAILGASTLAIFNYQKSSSSVVTSSLYALRVNPTAREVLGDEIYFKHQIPWIWGSIDQLHGRIDVHFSVKGTRESGMMRFKSLRRARNGFVSYFLLLSILGGFDIGSLER
jgi:cytochrome c oxidase assembly factor 1